MLLMTLLITMPGPIPHLLSQAHFLWALNLGGNRLSGKMSSFIDDQSSLHTFWSLSVAENPALSLDLRHYLPVQGQILRTDHVSEKVMQNLYAWESREFPENMCETYAGESKCAKISTAQFSHDIWGRASENVFAPILHILPTRLELFY